MSYTIRKDGDQAVITLPLSEVHGLRVALRPCPCKGSKAEATIAIRERLDKGLAKLEAMR